MIAPLAGRPPETEQPLPHNQSASEPSETDTDEPQLRICARCGFSEQCRCYARAMAERFGLRGPRYRRPGR